MSELAKRREEQRQAQEQTNRELQARIEQLEAQNRCFREACELISNATYRKITKPLRAVLDTVKGAPFRGEEHPWEEMRPGEKCFYLLSRGIDSLRKR